MKTEHLHVRLKPGDRPVRTRARRYPAEHRAFIRQHVEALVEAGLVYRNPGSRWASPPLIVKKGGGGFRMTVDVRAVNSQTEATQWPMPLLEVVLDHVQGATVFFSPDIFKGYWQLRYTPHARRCLRSSPIWESTPRRRYLWGERLGGILTGGGPRYFPRPALPRAASVVGRIARVCGRRREVVEPVGSSARDMPKNGVETQSAQVRLF